MQRHGRLVSTLIVVKWNLVGNMLTCLSLQVDHMTKLMLEGGRDESEDKENHRKENRRETWAPGLAGTVSRHVHVSIVCTQKLMSPAAMLHDPPLKIRPFNSTAYTHVFADKLQA